MRINLKKNELYQEIELFNDDNKKIGEAEVDIKGKMLSRLFIYEPYQNIGYGTEVVKHLCEEYGIKCLWVECANEHAIHVYRNCGFIISGETMYLMEKKQNEG